MINGITHWFYIRLYILGSKACQCDENDLTWRSDSGFFEELSEFPITEVAFGDLDANNERMNFTLYPLKCTGKN